MKVIAAFGALLADAAAVVALRPDASVLTASIGRPRATLAEHGVDGALLPIVGALAWLAAVWLGVGLASGLATRVPGAIGRVAAVVAGRLLPRAVLSLVSGSAGVGLLLAPVAAAAPVHATGGHPPAPAWPATSTSAPAWPTSGTVPATVPPQHGGHRPAAASPGRLTVRPGDSLWTIARDRLGPHATPARIAGQWPRWFAANRAVIGADPDLLQPGQVLRAPSPSSDPSSPEARP